jgi:hypothetical protein
VASSKSLIGTGQTNFEDRADWTTVELCEPNEQNTTYSGIFFRPSKHQIIPYSQCGETAFTICLIVDSNAQSGLATEEPLTVVLLPIARHFHQRERHTELSFNLTRLQVDSLLSRILYVAARKVELVDTELRSFDVAGKELETMTIERYPLRAATLT